MTIKIAVSIGEFLDKLTILQIKQQRIEDTEKLENITRELDALLTQWGVYERKIADDIGPELQALRQINETLWDIEDSIREKEAVAEFDQEFIRLARSVYFTNDKRAQIKRRINQVLNSGFIEEKSYKKY